jgi:hypothetical protein
MPDLYWFSIHDKTGQILIDEMYIELPKQNGDTMISGADHAWKAKTWNKELDDIIIANVRLNPKVKKEIKPFEAEVIPTSTEEPSDDEDDEDDEDEDEESETDEASTSADARRKHLNPSIQTQSEDALDVLVSKKVATIEGAEDVAKQLARGNQIIRFVQRPGPSDTVRLIAELLRLNDDGEIDADERYALTAASEKLITMDPDSDEYAQALQKVAKRIFASKVARSDPDARAMTKGRARGLSLKEQRRRLRALK